MKMYSYRDACHVSKKNCWPYLQLHGSVFFLTAENVTYELEEKKHDIDSQYSEIEMSNSYAAVSSDYLASNLVGHKVLFIHAICIPLCVYTYMVPHGIFVKFPP